MRPRDLNWKDQLRFAVPVGLLETLRAKRVLEAMPGASEHPWRAAVSPSRRKMLASSKLGFIPPGILRERASFVDVGANVGAWSTAALELAGATSVVAIEPSPGPFGVLESSLGQRPEVRLVNCAIGAHSGTAGLHLTNDSRWDSLLSVRAGVGAHYGEQLVEREVVTVEVKPLDEVVNDLDDISVVKIDTQGNERAVLEGARRTLARARAVLIEANFISHYEGDVLFCDLHERLVGEFGFTLHRLASPIHTPEGNLAWSDVVYTRG